MEQKNWNLANFHGELVILFFSKSIGIVQPENREAIPGV